MNSPLLMRLVVLLVLHQAWLAANPNARPQLSVASPDGAILATLTTGQEDCALGCTVVLEGRELFRFASLGMVADRVDLGLASYLAGLPHYPLARRNLLVAGRPLTAPQARPRTQRPHQIRQA